LEQFPCAIRLHDLKRTRCPLGIFWHVNALNQSLLNGRHVMHWSRIWSFERKHGGSYFIKITLPFIHHPNQTTSNLCEMILNVTEVWKWMKMELVWNVEKVGQWIKGGKFSNEWTCEIDKSGVLLPLPRSSTFINWWIFSNLIFMSSFPKSFTYWYTSLGSSICWT
jgi:hypothetical protein